MAARPLQRLVGGRGEVTVLPNGIDVEAWAPARDPRRRSREDGIRLVSAMRLASRKRPMPLLRMMTRVRELVPEGMFTPDTRLTLVQALHLKAPWHTAFDADRTQDGPFRTARGESVTARFMGGQTFDGVRGEGFVAARLPYAGEQLAMTVVLPDAGREAATAALVRGAGLPGLLTDQPTVAVALSMPRFSTTTTAQLTDPLEALGMGPAFDPKGADFSGMTGDEPLFIGDALQQAVITVDEQGTEAAAATAVVAQAVSGVGDLVRARLDRPFHAIVHDVATGTPLFVADVADPRG